MEETKNLYLVKSRSFRSYVVASDTNEAWVKFKAWLESLGSGTYDYGFSSDREFASIELVATTGAHTPKSASGTNFDDRNKDDKIIL